MDSVAQSDQIFEDFEIEKIDPPKVQINSGIEVTP